MTIVEFLTARYDEAESGIREALKTEDYGVSQSDLDDIAAKRQILALHQPDRAADTWYWPERECKECRRRWHGMTPPGTPPTVIGPETGCPTVRLLTSVYAAHIDYDQDWKP